MKQPTHLAESSAEDPSLGKLGKSHLPRFVGLDAIRFVSFIAICIFHITYIHYFTRDIAIAKELVIFEWMEVFTRSLAFSGFTIAFLTSLLTAYSGKGLLKRARLFLFLIIGWFLFSVLLDSGPELLVWDIYPLIFIGVFISTLAEAKKPEWSRVLGFIGFMMLWVPFWKISQWYPIPELPLDFHAVLGFADCLKYQVEWPIFPWIGLIWFGYASGQALRMELSRDGQADLTSRSQGIPIHLPELCVWILFIGLGVPFWGYFYHIKLAEFFACEAYRQPPYVWWSHMMIPVFLIRASLDPKVDTFLGRLKPLVWISHLAISRKFWVGYLFSYLLAHATSYLGTLSGLEQTPWRVAATAIFCAGYFVSIEVFTRLALSLVDKLSHKKII